MKEIWKDIVGYEGKYQVSNLGRVKSLNYGRTGKEKVLKYEDNNGYLRVNLCKNCKVKHYRIHRLVAQAFIPNPDNLPVINHKNEIKTDNRVQNLEWCTSQYNSTYNNQHIKRGIKLKKKRACYKNGILIKVYDSGIDTEKDGFSLSHVSRCCQGKRNSHKGFQWKYIS